MLILTLVVTICLTLKSHFPSGFTEPSFLPSVLCTCIKGNKAQSKETSCPGDRASHKARIKPSLGSSRSSLQTQIMGPLATIACLAENFRGSSWCQQEADTQNSSLQRGFLAPDHTDHSVWIVVITEALSSPGEIPLDMEACYHSGRNWLLYSSLLIPL